MQPVIVAERLTRRFDDFVAVDELDLIVEQGEVFGFLGPNGAGKTTTVRLLNGILDVSAGTASVLGMDVGAQAAHIRRRTGVLTETPSLYDALTARQNLIFFGDLYGVPQETLPRVAEDRLAYLGLADRADDKVGSFSKGMRQRLAIARALLHDPSLVFLDEPTSGLDPAASRMVTSMIRELSHQQGRTVFLCTHNLAEAQRLCDRVGVIDRGRLQAVGAPSELANQLWETHWVEIGLRDGFDGVASAALASMPNVVSFEMDKDTLVIEIDDDGAVPDIVTAVAAAGGRIYRVAMREHTLEEIYFEIQGHNHANAKQGVAP